MFNRISFIFINYNADVRTSVKCNPHYPTEKISNFYGVVIDELEHHKAFSVFRQICAP